MNIFKKLFGNKEKNVKDMKKVENSDISTPSNKLDVHIEKSTLQILTHQFFMHHQKESLRDNPNDPAWQNQTIYFWKAKEKFERKSLPPEFRAYQKHFFIVIANPGGLQLHQSKAIPWFGMEGNGDKYFVSFNGAEITLKELEKRKLIQYVEIFKLTLENAAVLRDRENYFWLMDTERVSYANDNFQYEGKIVSISKAVELGGLTLIKIKKN